MLRLIRSCFLAWFLVSASVLQAQGQTLEEQSSSDRPNFLIVVADDMGWSDPGFLGSKIRTPNIDSLAQRGVFMSQFYVAPTCSPTRSMLLTGVSNHVAGVGTMHHLQSLNQMGLQEYGAQLHDGVVTVAEMLRAHGYATMMTGKWHLAIDKDQYPGNRGFAQSYGLVEGGASHFSDQRRIVRRENVTYLENGKPVKLSPDFYSTIAYTDKMLEYIDGAGNKPFFAYLAYTAPHDPLQVPDDWLDRYKGVFDDGPAKAKENRRQRLIELGLLSKDAQLDQPLNFPGWLDSYKKPWAERSEAERKIDARRMEIYAAMIELLDVQFGRIIDSLKASGKLDNTYVLFMSDNGATITTPLAYRGNSRQWIHDNYDLSTEAMGKEGSFTTMGRDWANNSNTPFRMFKGTVGEGGVRSPLVIAGPGLAQGAVRNMPGHVMGLTPTIFELARINPKGHALYKDKLQPRGQSILPILMDDKVGDRRVLITELFGNRMVRKGRWKAVFVNKPIGSGEWELFDIVKDPSATTNLANENPVLIDEMRKAFDAFVEQNKVVLPDQAITPKMGATYEGQCNWWCEAKFSFVDVLLNAKQRNMMFALLAVLTLLIGIVIYRRRRRVKKSA